MAKVPYSNLEDGNPAGANDINQRFGDTLAQVNGNLDATNIKKASLTRELFAPDALSAAWPVGSVYITVAETNPGTFLGGNWVEFAKGKTLIGQDTADTDYNDLEKTGGAKTNTHNHWTMVSNDGGTTFVGTSGGGPRSRIVSRGRATLGGSTASGSTREDSTYNETISVVSPYIVVRFWKRVA